MGMVKRMALTSPEHLVKEITLVRNERDSLKDAFTVKLTEHIKTMDLQKTDLLILKKPGSMSIDLAREVIEGLTDRLKSRYGWEGVIIIQDVLLLGKMDPAQEKALYDTLKIKYERGADA
jgi:hypothetical protein